MYLAALWNSFWPHRTLSSSIGCFENTHSPRLVSDRMRRNKELSFWKYWGSCRLPKGSQEHASFPAPPWQNHESTWRTVECVYSFIPRYHYMWNARNPATKAKRVLKQRPTALKQVSRHPLPHQVLIEKNQPPSSDICTQEVWFPGNTNQSTWALLIQKFHNKI